MKYKELKYIFVLSVAVLLFMPALISAKGDKNGNGKRTLAKTSAGQVATAAMNINNLNALQNVTGFSDYNPDSNLEGTEYPKGTGKNAIYESGFLWGGYVAGNSQVQVGGSAYRSGLQPGPILANGQAADPTDPRWSIYRVRPDVYPGGPEVDLSGDAASTSYWDPANPVSADQIRLQYEHDWKYWPAHGNPNNGPDMDLGAPFKDNNNDGKYEPDVDVPGVPGADQTIFYVANDMNKDATEFLYGTDPLGLEVHVTMWAYAQQGALGNMYFKKFDLINKGFQKNTIDSMIVSWWADVDLGSASDDLVGNDTTLSLTYVYNGQSSDAVYTPLPPPATGADFFQGPLLKGVAGQDLNKNGIDDSQDYAIFNGQVVGPGYINLAMTAAFTFTNPGSGLDARFNDPSQGQPIGSTQFYDFMKGLNNVGGPYIDNNGNPSKFIFSGDPVARTGWLDGNVFPPRDVRSGMASGPFIMAPGDTQEVVVAEMVAGAVPGVSNLQAVNLLKVYDKTAQNAYDHFFNLPKAPPAPVAVGVAQNNKVIINWGADVSKVDATEKTVYHDVIDSIDASGGGDYKFEGYNIYQLPYSGATIEQAKKIATYDVINGVSTIPYTDPVTRTVEPSISIQSGSDSGIKRYYVDSVDAFSNNKPLNNGTPYYFAVTAYSYNPQGVPQSLETPISIVNGNSGVTPQSNPPGVTQVDQGSFSSSNIKHTGTANATVNVNVIDPLSVTGHQYKIKFHNETYSLGANGWTDITALSKLKKTTNLTGSSLTSAASYSETQGSIAIHYLVNVASVNYDYCDGVKIKLPTSVIIDNVTEPISNNTGDPIPYTFDKSTNTLFFGVINQDSLALGDSTNRSTNGVFAGGEDIKIVVHPATLPIITNYTMYDDNWGDNNGYPGGLVDVSGVDTLTGPIAKAIVNQNQWDVLDSTANVTVLKNQTILGGQDIYAPDVYFQQHSIMGPGGSSGSPTANVGTGANVVFNGLQVSINGSFAAPTTFLSLALNGNRLSINPSSGNYQISDFSLSFSGFGDGAMAYNTITSYGGAGGTHSITQLEQDYEIRWTGVSADTTINGQTVVITKSGGSLATLFGASNYSIADHPLNPNPGSTAPFTIRVPFEVWNIDKNEQVNVLVWDRNANGYNKPGIAADTFAVWNTGLRKDRDYVWVVNTKYNTAVIDPTSTIVADSATWNWVFFNSIYTVGDVIKVSYANPLQLGLDTFTFTVPKADTSLAKAKLDVNAINVFPNPYYGVNYLETTKYGKFVTFSHLPDKATIRIFNLAGYMVKTISHTGGTFEQWDLTNRSGLPVSSGLYIAYIDMPDVGTTKILKFSIIQEQQIPDHF